MLVGTVICDAKTNKITLEEVEKFDTIGDLTQPLTLEERVGQIEEVNNIQDELINVSLLATDEMFCMLEPLLSSVNIINAKGVSKMVDMYVAMVQRGIKDIEEVPLRYREEVRKIIKALEE